MKVNINHQLHDIRGDEYTVTVKGDQGSASVRVVIQWEVGQIHPNDPDEYRWAAYFVRGRQLMDQRFVDDTDDALEHAVSLAWESLARR
jgi:hypothetical protein